MKTILWATLTANGNYAQSTPDYPPKPEALRDFAEHAKAHGNFIVGRKTFEGFAANGPNPEFANLDIVVVSSRPVLIPGVHWAATPLLALQYLEERGHTTALLSGGESLHNAFLADNHVDETVINIAPVMEGNGLSIHLAHGLHKDVELLDVKKLGGGLVQLHYRLSIASA